MSDRAREDDEAAAWLLARERGTAGPTVSDATVARYTRLEALIADLPMPTGVAPSAGWQAGVIAAIDAAAEDEGEGEDEPGEPAEPAGPAEPSGVTPRPASDRAATARRPSRRRWAVPATIFAMAAVVAIVVLVRDRTDPEPDRPVTYQPSLAISIEPASEAHRGQDPSVGDKLIVQGVIDGPGELRVYDDAGIPRARCAAPAPDCLITRTGRLTTLRLTMSLRAPGTLRPVLFAAPLPGTVIPAVSHTPPPSIIDDDIAAATRVGIAVLTREPVHVR